MEGGRDGWMEIWGERELAEGLWEERVMEGIERRGKTEAGRREREIDQEK